MQRLQTRASGLLSEHAADRAGLPEDAQVVADDRDDVGRVLDDRGQPALDVSEARRATNSAWRSTGARAAPTARATCRRRAAPRPSPRERRRSAAIQRAVAGERPAAARRRARERARPSTGTSGLPGDRRAGSTSSRHGPRGAPARARSSHAGSRAAPVGGEAEREQRAGDPIDDRVGLSRPLAMHAAETAPTRARARTEARERRRRKSDRAGTKHLVQWFRSNPAGLEADRTKHTLQL